LEYTIVQQTKSKLLQLEQKNLEAIMEEEKSLATLKNLVGEGSFETLNQYGSLAKLYLKAEQLI
jgi:hypothetical protein